MDIVNEIIINLMKKKSTLGNLTRFISPYFFPSALDPNEYGEEREDYNGISLISIGADKEKQLDDVVKKCYRWQYMTVEQRKIFGDEVASLIFTMKGIKELEIDYENKNPDEMAHINGTSIKINANLTIDCDTPWPLISTISHEIQHRVQTLNNQFAKTYPRPNQETRNGYRIFDNRYKALKNYIKDDKFESAFYNADAKEIDANREEVEFLFQLEDAIYLRPSNGNKHKLLTSLDKYLSLEEDYSLSRMEDQVEISTRKDDVLAIESRIKDHITAFVRRFSLKSEKNGPKTPKQMKKDIKYLDSIAGQKDLLEYLEYCTVNLDPRLHRELLHSFIANQRLEALSVLNTYGFEYTMDELKAVTEILLDNCNSTTLVPNMHKLLTHVNDRHITEVCSELIGKDQTESANLAIQVTLRSEFAKYPNLRNFNGEKLDYKNRNQYSFFLNNFYPYKFNEYADTFLNKYVDHFVSIYSHKINQIQTPERIIEIADQLYYEDIQPLIAKGNLQSFTILPHILYKTKNNEVADKKPDTFVEKLVKYIERAHIKEYEPEMESE